MTRMFIIAAIGIVVAGAGVFGYQATQPPLKERFLAQLRAKGGDFISIARAECVFDKIVERHGIETMRSIFNIWDTVEAESRKKQGEFDKRWANRREKRDILLKMITARVACEKPTVFGPAILRAARHTPPVALYDWEAEVKRVGDANILFLKCRLQNQMHIPVAVLDGRIRFLSADGAEVHAVAIDRKAVLVAGETISILDTFVVDAGGPTLSPDQVHAVLDVKLIRTEEGVAFTY